MMETSMQPGTFASQLPFHMVWLATNICNARCRHCSSNSAQRLPDELSTEEALELIGDFADAGVVDMAISGGEPLLRKDLFRIIEHARRNGISVGVGSNGSTITKSVAQHLLDSGINRLQISLDGLPSSHDELRCWPGLHLRVWAAVDIAHAVGLRVHLCCTVTRLNFRELENFTEYVAARDGVSRINFSRYVPTGRGNDTLDLTDTEWHEVIVQCCELKKRYKSRLEIVSHLAQEILVDDEVLKLPSFIGCQAGRGQGCVTSNGTVFPCVLLPIPIGNIRQTSLRNLWSKSEIIQKLQDRKFLQGYCGDCTLKSRCGGCRAVAFARTGDYLSSDPRCWLVPENS